MSQADGLQGGLPGVTVGVQFGGVGLIRAVTDDRVPDGVELVELLAFVFKGAGWRPAGEVLVDVTEVTGVVRGQHAKHPAAFRALKDHSALAGGNGAGVGVLTVGTDREETAGF